MPELADVFDLCTTSEEKEYDRAKLESQESTYRQSAKENTVSNLIVEMLDSIDDKSWSEDSTNFETLLQLMEEHANPSGSVFTPPTAPTEFNDDPEEVEGGKLIMLSPEGGYVEVEDDGVTPIGPVTQDGTPLDGHPALQAKEVKAVKAKKSRKGAAPRKNAKKSAMMPKKKEAPKKKALAKPEPANLTIDWSDFTANAHMVVLVDKTTSTTIAQMPLGQYLEDSGTIANIVRQAREEFEQELEETEITEPLTMEDMLLPRSQRVTLESDLGTLVYRPKHVVVDKYVFAMYFHEDTPASFIPKVGKSFEIRYLLETFQVQYMGGEFLDPIHPEYHILTFVVVDTSDDRS